MVYEASTPNLAGQDNRAIGRLIESVKWSERQLQKIRQERIEYIRKYVGSHYTDGGSDERIPVNFLRLAIDIYIRQLAAQSPRVLISTTNPDLRPVASNLELAINQIPDEINLGRTLRKFVMEALFGIGVAKVGISEVGSMLDHPYGEVFTDVVTFDDFFMDMAAKEIERIQYIGNNYWLNFEDVKDGNYFEKNKTTDLQPDVDLMSTPDGSFHGSGITTNEQPQQYKDRIWLRDCWLPEERKLITYAISSGQVLKTVDWDGPDDGPYHILGFSDVPGNLLPLAPVASWIDLHELSNSLFRKMANAADGQKSVAGFRGGDDESAKNFKDAQDGDGITYAGTPPIQLKVGGVDNNTLAFSLQVQQLQSYFAGNLDALGGLGAQTETVGQDKLLSEAAGARLRDMAARTVDAIQGVFRSIAHYEWNDPVRKRQLQKPIPGTDLTIPVQFGPRNKKGKLNKYDLTIDTYSLAEKSPGIQLQKLNAFIQQSLLPMAPMIMQGGNTIEWQKIIRLQAKYADMPEIDEIITWAIDEPVQGEHGGPGNRNSTTEHVRRNVAQPTDKGNTKVLQQALLGKNSQESEAKGL